MIRSFRWVGALLVLALLDLYAPVLRAAGREPRWLRISTPEFVVITSLNEKEGLAWAGDFAQYVATLRTMFKQSTALPPLVLVVFARESDFKKYRPLSADGRPQEVAGFFSRNLTWSVAGLAGSDVDEETRRTIFHEGVHWFLSTLERSNPVWIEEGMAEVFSTFKVAKNQAEWGHPIIPHVALLRRHGLMPMERLLLTSSDELFGKDESHTTAVYAQSWAFAHYLLFGKHEIPTSALGDYAEAVGEAGPDEAFRRAFGRDYKAMQKQFKDYIDGGTYYVRRRELAKFEAPKLETASRLDVEEALGRLAIGAQLWPLAATHGRAAVAAAPEDPRAHGLLGTALRMADDRNGAVAEFTRAVELGSKDALPYFELAVEEHNQNAADGPSLSAPLSPDIARRVANRYERAINLHPRFQIAYQNLASILSAAETVSQEDRRFLEFGRRIWPTNLAIQVGLAVLSRHEGDKSGAIEQLNRVLAAPAGSDPQSRDFARRLLESWEQNDLIATVNQLVEAKKFAECLAYVDQQLEKGVGPALRTQMLSLRQFAETGLAWGKVETALNERNWVEARRLIGALLQSDAPVPIKNAAERVLRDLDRQRLGLEAARK